MRFPRKFSKEKITRRRAFSPVSSIGSRSKRRKQTWIATTTPLKGVAAVDIKPAAVLHHQHNNFSALCDLCEPLNVIVIGPHDSGKTTVINSLLMSVRGTWTDRAKYGHGSAHQLSPVLVYENPNHHHQNSPEHKHYDPQWKRPQHVSCGRVTFWDTRGFEKIADKEKAALILRYILEGRLNFRLFTQALLMEKEEIKRIRESNRDLQIDLILYVASAKEKPNLELFDVIQNARKESKLPSVRSVPILTALTKYDLLSPEEISRVDEQIQKYHPNSLNQGNLPEEALTPYHVIAYNSKVNPMDDEFIPPTPDKRRNGAMLKLFMEIIALARPNGRRRINSASAIMLRSLSRGFVRRRHRSNSNPRDRFVNA